MIIESRRALLQSSSQNHDQCNEEQVISFFFLYIPQLASSNTTKYVLCSAWSKALESNSSSQIQPRTSYLVDVEIKAYTYSQGKYISAVWNPLCHPASTKVIVMLPITLFALSGYS